MIGLTARFANLIKAYQGGLVSFRNVAFFQLEEFQGIDKNDPRSYAYRLYEAFFKHVDVVPQNVYFLNGVARDYLNECALFENAIAEHGGIQLFIANVNSEASIGGNPPGSSLSSRTRQKKITVSNLHDRSYSRNGIGDYEACPQCGDIESYFVLTMGIGNIMDSHEVVALFLGRHCARALHRVVEEPVANMYPASILQYHEHVIIVCDRFSTSTLKYTSVEYFVGLRDNYNVVNHLESEISFRGTCDNAIDEIVATPLADLRCESPVEEIEEDPEHRRSFLGCSNRVESVEEVVDC